MAAVEITVREDDDVLAELNRHRITERDLPWMRARGSNDSVLERDRYPFENPQVFDNCQHCDTPLSGCISGGRGEGAQAAWTLVLTCGHVLCEQCKDDCERTEQHNQADPPLYECSICREYGAANKLPSTASLEVGTCQTSYCSGESFAPPRHRCSQCLRTLCENCLPEHTRRYPDHELTDLPMAIVNELRDFTGCATHHEPVQFRCDCGEMLCQRCPYNYTSQVPGTNRVLNHDKTRMEEVDLSLEDALEDTIGTMSRIRDMRALAAAKRAELEEATDRVANEVALHFNQIIVQAIQRCFDVLKRLKKVGGVHHAAINNHLAMLDKTERQLNMGVEMDERARSRAVVHADSVAQYVRNVAYGLCKPAMAQFHESKEFSAQLESVEFALEIPAPATTHIMREISRWGEHVLTNAEDTSRPLKEVRIVPSRLNGADNKGLCVEGAPIRAATVPLRLHSALDHFTDLYEQRYAAESAGQATTDNKRVFPFQLGERTPPGATEDRYAYEHTMHSRPGIHFAQPKMFGGSLRVLNLRGNPDLNQKEVQAAHARTPHIAPIWMPEEDYDQTSITDLRSAHDTTATDEEMAQAHHTDTLASALARCSESPSVVEGEPSTPILLDDEGDEEHNEDFHRPVDLQQLLKLPPQQQPTQPRVPTVLRKKNLVFVKKGELPPKLQPEAELAPPPALSRQAQLPAAHVNPAPIRMLGPSILRRTVVHPQPSPSMHFRPATNAERTSASGAPPPKRALLLTAPGSGPKRLLIKTPTGVPPRLGGFNDVRSAKTFRDSNGAAVRLVSHNSQQLTRMAPPRPGPVPAAFRPIASTAGRATLASMLNEDVDQRSPIRVNSVRVVGTAENRFKTQLTSRCAPYGREEIARRAHLRNQGFAEAEIDRILLKERVSKHHQPDQGSPHPRIFVPRKVQPVDPNRPTFPVATYVTKMDSPQPATNKKMLSIEKAFTNMFGADGSIIPEISNRRRGRPSKDDPTAPSNIIQEFRKHATQWPPKFEEMNQSEMAELQDLIDQLDTVTREEDEEARARSDNPFGLFENGVKSEEEEPLVAPWQNWSHEEREQIKAAAKQKIDNASNKLPGKGCFVCALCRKHEGRPRTWQCNECYNIGRALTPIEADEVVEPPRENPVAMALAPQSLPVIPPLVDIADDDGDLDEAQPHGSAEVDLSALFQPVQKVERRGRPKKQKEPVVPEDPTPAPAPVVRIVREPRKRRVVEAVEEAEQDEEVVMGTTRRGRQIKMPAKLKGHEVHTAHTTTTTATTTTKRRSPSEGSEASHHSAVNTPLSTPSAAASSSPMKKMVKEESPERVPRSAMDGPKRGGRRRH